MSRALLACAVAFAGCANNVPQDRSTGPDGRMKGAQAIKLEENEGKVRGIVTYPGGDRVDWKSITLPEGARGQLALQMTYTTPRPGLKVSFDVFDQWNTPVTLASVSGGRGRIRSGTINGAKGKYYVRIYAPRRGDAGAYKLLAEFKPEAPQIIFDPRDYEVSAPPKLPAVPDAPVACTTHDPANPECDKICAPGAPSNWKGCPPPQVTPPTTTATTTTPPPPPANPITTRMMKLDTVGGGVEITLPVGSSSGVNKTWKVRVLRGETTAPLPGGAGTVVRVNSRYTIVRVSLTPDQLNANPNVVLEP